MSRSIDRVRSLGVGGSDLVADSAGVLDSLVSQSPLIEELKRLIRQVAPSDISVLITGESGTGKELVARALHHLSRRAKGPLITLNCGAIPEGIFESEIFGHEKGSFTSAEQRRRGYFEMADGGTLFLDEIGEMPFAVQVKLLRVLETGTFLRVGGSEEIRVNVRIVTATNRDLSVEVSRRRFRQDLYYRLKAVQLHLPPLRERSEDIPLLTELFIHEFAERNRIRQVQLTPAAVEVLKRQYWRGNVRELKNFVESLVALTTTRNIDDEQILERLSVGSDARNLPVLVSRPTEETERELLYRTLLELRAEMAAIKSLLTAQMEHRNGEVRYPLDSFEDVELQPLDDLERDQIQRTLDRFKGSRRRAALALGIGERTLYRKIKRYGLE